MKQDTLNPAERAVELLRQHDRNGAAKVLLRAYGPRLNAWFKRNSLANYAEELTSDTVMGFIKAVENLLNKGAEVNHAEGLLHLCKKRSLWDLGRAMGNERRGGGQEILSLDDEASFDFLHALMTHPGDSVTQVVLADCIAVALAEMEKKYPVDVLLLRMRYEGDLDIAELVALFPSDPPKGAKSGKTAKNLAHNMSQRLLTARERAVDYVQHCKD